MSSHGCHNKTTKSSKLQRFLKIRALRVLLDKAFQALKEIPDDSEVFNPTNFRRFDVYLFEFFSTQLKIKLILIFSLTVGYYTCQIIYSLDTLQNQNATNAEKIKNGVINLCIQTEFATSSQT